MKCGYRAVGDGFTDRFCGSKNGNIYMFEVVEWILYVLP